MEERIDLLCLPISPAHSKGLPHSLHTSFQQLFKPIQVDYNRSGCGCGWEGDTDWHMFGDGDGPVVKFYSILSNHGTHDSNSFLNQSKLIIIGLDEDVDGKGIQTGICSVTVRSLNPTPSNPITAHIHHSNSF